MKKILLAVLFLTGMVHFSFGQNAGIMVSENKRHPNFKNETPEAAAKRIVNFYAGVLNLNLEQQREIYKPILKAQKKIAATPNADEQSETLIANHYSLQEAFKNIFTYSQYLKYEQMEDYPDGVENPNTMHNSKD